MPHKIGAPLLLTALLTLARITLAADIITIPDNAWHLWPDTKAPWKDDTLYLPDETPDLSKLPVNPPTGGWETLDSQPGIQISLPSTVEQHYWGQFGLRPCDPDEYGYAAGSRRALDHVKVDTDAQIGNYQGVSWWWRSIDVPASFQNKIVLLHIRGARQRAEVFVNRQLVGYDLIEETAFDCDITKAIHPGQTNEIAIRITNPGGRMDWIDFLTLNWGKYTLPATHGFGGLDRGITLTAHDPIYLQDLWALNTATPRTITAHATIQNTTATPWQGTVHFEIRKKGSEGLCLIPPFPRHITT